MMRLLITGGAGAVGSNLVTRTLCDGHEVVVLDDLSSGRRELVPETATFIEGSVADDAALERAFAHRPTHVVHLAALFANQNSIDHPLEDLNVNGLGTLKVLTWAAQCGVSKLVYCSSSCVYGHAALDEDDFIPSSSTPYAITKFLGEQYCRFWRRQQDLDVTILRLFNSYGPNEYPGRYRNVVPNFFKLAMNGEALPITGTGEETRDFTFVSDTVDGILSALIARTVAGEAYNIASGCETRIIDLANKINRLVGNPAGVRFVPRREWDHIVRRKGPIEKARAGLGFSPRISLDEGLERTLAWFKTIDV